MVETPTGKLLRVTDTYTERIQVEAFLGMSIRQRLSGATAPESASAMCSFDTAPNPLQLSTAQEEAGSRKQLLPPN